MYDFGSNCSGLAGGFLKGYTCNQAKYGQDEPPAYDLGEITVKAAMLDSEWRRRRRGRGEGARALADSARGRVSRVFKGGFRPRPLPSAGC